LRQGEVRHGEKYLLKPLAAGALKDNDASMRANAKKNTASEHVVHASLLRDCARLIDKLYEIWGREKTIRPSLILFPSRYLPDDTGRMINGVVSMDLEGEPDHEGTIKRAVERTLAFAFFYVRMDGNKVRALLESPQGTREWTIPIAKSGLDQVLTQTIGIKNDEVTLGILWAPTVGRTPLLN
jgi:hypothetical protein